MFFFTLIPYKLWQKYATFILFISFGLLIIVLIPGIGIVRGGAQSWIGVGAFSIQPSEFIKLALILYLAAILSTNRLQITSFLKGFLPIIVLLFTTFGLIMLQPDLGTGIVLVITCMVIIYVGGAKITHFVSLIAIALGGLALLI